jgi:two-component system, NarL family, sensor kinase
MTTQTESHTRLHGRWLLIARLAWLIMFLTLTAMYVFGFFAVRDTLSTVCEQEPCKLVRQIRHSESGDKIMGWPGPSVGSAERLLTDQVQALEKLGLTHDQYGLLGALQLGIPALVLLLIAAGLFWWKSDDWMVLFASIMVATFPIHNTPLPFTLMVHEPAWEWVYDLVSIVALSCLWIFFLIFPNGQFVPRWTRWLAIHEITGAVIAAFFGNTLREDPTIAVFFGAVFLLPSFCIGAYAQLYRYFRVARPAERQQFKWVAFGLVGFVVTQLAVLIPLNALLTSAAVNADPARALVLSAIPDTLWQVNLLLIPVCITISVIRYRLWDIDIIISRTLVYGTLTASVVGLYVLIVGGFGILFQLQSNLPGIIIAILSIAFLFQPLRLRVQRAVNRVTFGGRDVPSPKQEIEESSSESQVPLRQHWLAWLLFTLICSLSALSLVFLALSWATPVPDTWGFRGDAVILALAFGSIGLLLARHHLQNPIGWLFLIAGLVNASLEFCIEYAAYVLLTKPGALPGGVLAAWMASWLWVIVIAMLIYTFLLFPTGHLPSMRWRTVAWFIVGAFALMTFAFMIRPGPLYFAPYLDNPFAAQVANRLFSPIAVVSASAILLVGISIIVRLRRAEGVERQQLKWFAYAATLVTIIGMSDSVANAAGLIGTDSKFYQYLTVAIWIAIPFAIAFAILRYRLWDIDIFINRSLVYGTLIVSVIALYMIVVGVAGALFQAVGNTLLAILATGLIAVLFHPLRQRLQRGINRLMYGERDEPYTALSRLGRQLEASLAPEAILPTVVTTVRDVLRLPYVAIYLQQDSQGYKIVAESASPLLRVENGRIRVPGMEREGRCFPLIHQGETLGYIVLGPRAPNEAFSSTDLRLLDDLAPQVGVAVHAVRLTADLQRSRERLVLAREEERRRLRRDLHDDLGPTLASLGLAASTVADLIPTNPTMATILVKELESQMRATVANIRRLVYDLRPPTLDELGLLPAVRERATRFSNAPQGFHVIVDAPVELPTLPAAVEVAAYRIVQEALENVAKHSHARQCMIRFANHDGLEIEITDDGVGLPPNITPGVGLRSMRERAEELGGTCVIERGVNGGTRMLACLPIGEFDGTFAHPDRG